MNRIDFMGRLALLLSDLPESEREEAIQYYNDYLNDAGVENEEEVLAELGTPEQLAASIKEGLRESGNAQGEFSENGYQENSGGSENEVVSRGYREENCETADASDSAGRKREQRAAPENDRERNDKSAGYHGGQDSAYRNGAGRQSKSASANGGNFDRRYRSGRKKGMSGGMIALIVILCILSAPITIPVIFALGVLLLTLLLVMIPIILLLLFIGVICVIAGIASFFGSAVDLFTFPAGAVLGIGMSLFTIGMGILLTLGIGWIISRVFPNAFRKAVDFCSGLFHKKGGNEV